MLTRVLSFFRPAPVLENGLADFEVEALELYQAKLNRMNEIQLCAETGTTHRDFVVHNLTKEDLKDLAMKNKIRQVSGYYFE